MIAGKRYVNINSVIGAMDAEASSPSQPTNVYAIAGNGLIKVFFDPPLSLGGAEIDYYRVVLSNGVVVDGTKSPIIAFSPNNEAVTAVVIAHNKNGYGAASSPTNVVTPTAGVDYASRAVNYFAVNSIAI